MEQAKEHEQSRFLLSFLLETSMFAEQLRRDISMMAVGKVHRRLRLIRTFQLQQLYILFQSRMWIGEECIIMN